MPWERPRKVELLSFVAVCPPYPPLSHYSDSTIIIDKARKYVTVGYKNFKRKRVIHRWKSTNKPTYQRPLSNSVKTCCFSIHLHGAFDTADPWIAQEVRQIKKIAMVLLTVSFSVQWERGIPRSWLRFVMRTQLFLAPTLTERLTTPFLINYWV